MDLWYVQQNSVSGRDQAGAIQLSYGKISLLVELC